jgi:hypothetical protein
MEMTIDDEDGTDIFEVPEMSNGLEYEIEVSQSSFRLGSILPDPPPQSSVGEKTSPKRKRGRPRKNSG